MRTFDKGRGDVPLLAAPMTFDCVSLGGKLSVEWREGTNHKSRRESDRVLGIV